MQMQSQCNETDPAPAPHLPSPRSGPFGAGAGQMPDPAGWLLAACRTAGQPVPCGCNRRGGGTDGDIWTEVLHRVIIVLNVILKE